MPTDDQVRKNIAENVLRLLEDRGWSQSELSRRTGNTQQSINLICNAQRVCGAGVLARIAEAFDVSMDRLASPPPEPTAARRQKSLAVAS